MSQRNKWPVIEKESAQHWRRSVCIYTKRQLLMPMMELFDAPTTTDSCAARMESVVPTQALVLMNDEFAEEQAGFFAERALREGGEFGRSPVAENGKGRDHHPKGFTMWMAGGGIKGGMIHGETDEFGYEAISRKVSVPDLHATMLHQLGLYHEDLTFRHSGRDYRLTDVSGDVVTQLLAKS